MKAVQATCAGRGGGDGARSSATLGCSRGLSLLPYFFNYRIFSYKEKNTRWAWQVAHSTGIGWYSVCELGTVDGRLPSILMNLGKSSSPHTTYHTGSWGFRRSKRLLWPTEKCLSVLSASQCTTEEWPLTITFQRLD